MPTPDELAAQARARADAIDERSPGARLRAAIEIGDELSDAGDALVERFVSEARAAGLSWAQIGEQFGTSKQAAQKRYGAAMELSWPGRWAPAAQQALVRAEQDARELGVDYVGTEHLLLGLLATDGGLAAMVLGDLGVTREGVLSTSCMTMTAGEPRRGRDGSLAVMPRLKQGLEDARRIAERLGKDAPGTEHLLAGMVCVPGAMAVEILRRLGVSSRDLRRALAAELDVETERLVVNHRRRRRLLAKVS